MGSIIEKFYSTSPIWFQQIMVAVYGWHWYHRRYSREFFPKLYQEFSTRDFWSLEKFLKYQEEQLNSLFKVSRNSPYYSSIFAEMELKPNISSFEILARFPFLSKGTLRTRGADLLTEKLPKGTMIFKSSGTTGTPTEIYFTRRFHSVSTAVAAVRSLGWGGVTHKERRVIFASRKICRYDQSKPPFYRYSPTENMAYASIYHLSQKFLPYYMDFLRSFQPAVIMGYPSALNIIAQYALEHNDMPTPAKVVITTAETVTQLAREAIETAWQCKVFDRYGAIEGCVFVSQCEHGRYHVSPEIGIVEIVDSTGHPVPPNVMGEVVCTGLQNLFQPLIRYRIGDVARWSTVQNCPCGREMPIIEAIEGRFEDICITSDGRKMLRFGRVFVGFDNIVEAQVIQEKLTLFVIKVVPTKSFGQHDIELIKNNMRLHVGDIEIQVKLVDAIHRTEAGKFKAVICNLTEEEKKAIR